MAKQQEKIGARIRVLRERLGVSQGDLARKAGLAPSHMSAVERGQKNMSIQTIEAIAGGLEVTFEDLVAGEHLEQMAEVEKLLLDIPSRLRPAMTRLIREAVLVIRQASHEAGERGTR